METRVTKLLYGWSKWGGANYGMARKDNKEWYCQACRDLQHPDLPGYFFSLDEEKGEKRDFFRVCSDCKFNAVQNQVLSISALISIVRR